MRMRRVRVGRVTVGRVTVGRVGMSVVSGDSALETDIEVIRIVMTVLF